MIWFRVLYYKISDKIKCMLGKHYSVQVIDEADISELKVSPLGVYWEGRIKKTHFECRRCKKRLEFGISLLFDQRKKDGDNS